MTSTPSPTTARPPHELGPDAFAERMLDAFLGACETLAHYLGERLGWYAALAGRGPLTAPELARCTDTQSRYAREWLESQAANGVLTVVGADDDDPDHRRYALPPGHAEVLTDADSLVYLGPLPRLLAAVGGALPELLTAYRDGGGVSWDRLGADAREAQADLNRPLFRHRLGPALRELAAVAAVLDRPGARVVDVGCGAGHSSAALAAAFPGCTVTGVDVDRPSLELAAAQASDRVRFRHADIAEWEPEESYQAAFFFECLHDLPHPVQALSAARAAVEPDGLVIVVDEAVGERFSAPADPVDRLMYAYSTLICLPDGMAHPHSAATGTVLRPPLLERYARAAGFTRVEVLPVPDFGFFRCYRLS